ncbi:hypothetical protein TRIP_B90004 [uncultured Desulfatiglans sp.]|uniref:Helicase/UvrB N-terminal domain-containing protein n=1 Tax=Uncultured Desulfatiglans sp. TaxID=1748965 RepID=A0A653AKC2_UNCDX|nr:hypothetical protein TRIP_B90004 [uncultured Desulfatiglans sp.]
MTNEETPCFFNDTQAYIPGNPDLRNLQVEGWFRTRQHFRNSSEHAIVQIPVGCGKTGLMVLLFFGIAKGRVLVIVPKLERNDGLPGKHVADAFQLLSPRVVYRCDHERHLVLLLLTHFKRAGLSGDRQF